MVAKLPWQPQGYLNNFFVLSFYEVHIWNGGSLGQWKLATHPVAMVAWFPWQPQ